MDQLRVLILLVLPLLGICMNDIHLKYILTKNGSNFKPSCIAEERERYMAVGWIYPIPDKENSLPNITRKYIPSIENDFNCNFSNHSKCTKIWKIKNWKNSENFQLVLDSRWEDLPTIFTKKSDRDFKERIEIPSVFNISFSVRSSGEVKVLLCEGWNPYNYPCYSINISNSEIYLHKYPTFPKNFSNNFMYLDYYKAYSNVLTDDEWRHFVITFNHQGILSLIDVSLNRTVIEHEDKNPLKPIYLLVKSTNSALWKIHKYEFIHTTSVQLSRLGPILNSDFKHLCLSLFVSVCSNCIMNFIMMEAGQRIILKEVFPTQQEFEWQIIKIKHENILESKITIFVDTKYADDSLNQTEGFWAIDDIRVCDENEIKLTFLNTEVEETDSNISCQLVAHTKWRPKKLIFSKNEEISGVTTIADQRSVNLTWKSEDTTKQISHFITYEANDLCDAEPFNRKRMQSKGFLITTDNEITITDLVPYTKYNISISSMLQDVEKKIYVTTEETDMPTPEEIPNKIQVQVDETKAYISWEKVDCTIIYGHILYSLKLTNNVLNSTHQSKIQSENYAEIGDLEPYTSYTLNILTARNFDKIQSYKNAIGLNINFTTRAGTAPPIRNLETYSIDRDSVSLRYDLPLKSNGIPKYAQVIRCIPILFKKCKSSISTITPCKLWPRKYCIDVNNLIALQQHTFKISIKNDLTHIFGKETSIEAFTNDRIPTPPTNITYKIVDCKESLDYCHLNISWLHPYDQNGTITAYNIFLNGTNGDTTENIQDVYKVVNKSYASQYEYQIKYIPYSTHYELFIQSVNNVYKSSFAHIYVKTDNIGDHIDQKPKLVNTSANSLIFKLSPVDQRLQSYKVLTVVQDFDKTQKIDANLLKKNQASDHLCHNFGDTWLLDIVEVNNSNNNTVNITIGSGDKLNKYLKANTQYCITFVVINNYKNAEHDVVYFEKLQTPKNDIVAVASSFNFNYLYLFILLLLLIPIGFYVHRYFKNQKSRKQVNEQTNGDNVYESMPFEDCDENCVNNDTYDHLLHK